MKKLKRDRTSLKKRIRSPLTISEWETVDHVLTAASGVLPLPKTEPDRPFNDRISDTRCCPSYLDDLSTMGEGGKPVEMLWILIRVLGRFVSLEWGLYPG